MPPRPRWPYRRQGGADDLPPDFVEPPPPEPTVPMPAAPPSVPADPGFPPEEPPPSRELWPWLLLFAIVVIGGLAIGWALSRDENSAATTTTVLVRTESVPTVTGAKQPATTVRVPNVIGLPAARAEQTIGAAGLRPQRRAIASTRPVATVIAQDPAAAATVVKNSLVILTVSKGREQVAVPALVGSSEAVAGAALRSAGLVAGVFRVTSDRPPGTIVAQDPRAGERVDRGSRVRINVSKGAPATTSVTTTTATTTSTPTTTVTRTTTTAPPPPRLATVPDVRGRTLRAARRTIRRAGLLAAVVYINSREPANTVIAQFPKPDERVKRGARVRINISLGAKPKPQVTIPDVTGLDEATATSDLEQAGFVVEKFDQETTHPSEEGVVLDQDPAGQTRAPKGSFITIYVGRFTG